MKETIARMSHQIEEARELLKRAGMLARCEEKEQIQKAKALVEDAMAKLSLVQAYIDHMSYAKLDEKSLADVQRLSVTHDNLVVKAEMLNDSIKHRG